MARYPRCFFPVSKPCRSQLRNGSTCHTGRTLLVKKGGKRKYVRRADRATKHNTLLTLCPGHGPNGGNLSESGIHLCALAFDTPTIHTGCSHRFQQPPRRSSRPCPRSRKPAPWPSQKKPGPAETSLDSVALPAFSSLTAEPDQETPLRPPRCRDEDHAS